MRDLLRMAALGLFTGALLILAYQAPGTVARELQFPASILVLTLLTRSVSAGSAVSALGLGGGPVVLLVVAAGRAMSAAGLDTTQGLVNWALIPIVEEALKLAPVALLVFLHVRRARLSPNPSDLLMLGCLAGAGFALAENSLLLENNAGVAADMARRYGPHVNSFYLVPGAWGAAGYAGHAAATGFIAGGLGLGLALRYRLRDYWWAIPAACAAWIVFEHMLTNLYVGSGSRFALLLGNGRLTPWLFVLLAAAVIALDVRRHYATLAASRRLRLRVAMTRAALLRTDPPAPESRIAAGRLYLSQLRLVNATAWFVHRHPRPPIERRA
ncbi:MAG TPA: PrsW family glutamic-type intramembrane protease [Vicinamibacterales bacterium]|nr:PrsW family glutamic-type intramembrane protease [Vicinamibacterales bacterium]